MQKTAPGGGIALRATLAALLALGSMPALSALPDYAPVAWAESNSSSSTTSEITDLEIKNLDYAYKLELGQERLESKSFEDDSSHNEELQVEKQLAFFNKTIPNFTFEPCFAEMLNEFKARLNSNTNFVEIPVDTSYSEILQTANNSSFYNLLNTKNLSADVLTQTDAFGNNLKSCSDSCLMSASSAFKEKVSRLLLKDGSWCQRDIYPQFFTYGAYGIFNERNIFLGTSKTGTLALEISDIYGGLKSYYSGSIIDPSSTSSTNYQVYKGLGTEKTILQTYKLLSNESQRISMKDSKTFYRVQINQEFKLGFEARCSNALAIMVNGIVGINLFLKIRVAQLI